MRAVFADPAYQLPGGSWLVTNCFLSYCTGGRKVIIFTCHIGGVVCDTCHTKLSYAWCRCASYDSHMGKGAPEHRLSVKSRLNIFEVPLPQMSLHFYLAFRPLANCTWISTQMNQKLFEPPASCCLALPQFEGSFMILIFLIRRIPWLWLRGIVHR